MQTFRALEFEPRAIQAAHADRQPRQPDPRGAAARTRITRVALIKTLADQEGVRILPREPGDRCEPFESGALSSASSNELSHRLGEGTIVAQLA